MNTQQQISTFAFSLILFSASDFNLIALTIIGTSLLLKEVKNQKGVASV